MKQITIVEAFQIPGTKIILEKGDKISIKKEAYIPYNSELSKKIKEYGIDEYLGTLIIDIEKNYKNEPAMMKVAKSLKDIYSSDLQKAKVSIGDKLY